MSLALPKKKKPVEIAYSVNKYLERTIPLLAPLGVVLGLVLPQVFLVLKPAIPWLFGTMTLAGALKLRARELGETISSPMPILFFFVTAHVFLPLAVLFLSRFIFPENPDLVSGYVLLHSVPTAVTSFIWVSIFRGNLALTLTIILLSSILAPVIVPGTVRLLLGTSVNLNITGITLSLIFMIAIPTIVGVSLNEISRKKIPFLISPWLDPVSKLCMILVIAANSAAAAPQIYPVNQEIWIIIAVCIGFSALGFVCGRLTGIAGKLEREKQISLFFASGLRNTSAAMTLGVEFFPPAAALPAVLGIMFQQTTAAVMGRLLLGKSGRHKNKASFGMGE
jgi:tagaturonate reductase